MRRSGDCFSSPDSNGFCSSVFLNHTLCSCFLQTLEISSCTSHAPGWPAYQVDLPPQWRASTAVVFPTLCLPAEQHVLHDEATDNAWNSPTVALWILLFQCFQKAWRWCPPQTDTPQLWSCTRSPHWKSVFNYKQIPFEPLTNLDQTSILKPENVSWPLATSGGWKAGVPCASKQ